METYAFSVQMEGGAITQFKQLETEATKLNTQVTEMHTSFGTLGEKVRGLGVGFKNMALGALGVGGMFAGIEFLKTSREYYDKFEESNTRLKATLQSTGGVAGITFKQFKEDADRLSGVVIFPKSSIVDAQAMLAMFTSIRGEMMSQTLPIAADLATKFGIDLPQAAKLLGRSLENLSLGRLQMQLGNMSAAQLAQIKHFKETGEVAKAQAVILDFVKEKVGGLSEAMAKTDAGKLEMAKKSMSGLKLAVGGLVSGFMLNLVPAFQTIAKMATDFINWITGDSDSAYIFKEVIEILGGALLLYGTYLGIVALKTKLVTAAQWLWNIAMDANPIVLIVIAVIALIATLAALWDKCEGFRRVVGEVFGAIAKIVMGVVHIFTSFAKMAGDVFTGKFSEAGEEGKEMIKNFKDDFINGWGEIKKKGDEFANSDFKFSALLGIKGSVTSALGAPGAPGTSPKPTPLTDAATNTSLLGGASGGLGEAKTVKIDFHKALMEINVPGGNGQDIINKAPMTMEVLLRILNNLALSQGSTM